LPLAQKKKKKKKTKKNKKKKIRQGGRVPHQSFVKNFEIISSILFLHTQFPVFRG